MNLIFKLLKISLIAFIGFISAIGIQPYITDTTVIDSGDFDTFTFCDGGRFIIKTLPRWQPRIEISCGSDVAYMVKINNAVNSKFVNVTFNAENATSVIDYSE